MQQQVIVTVEAQRCWQCVRLIHPSEPLFRRTMLTAVEFGRLEYSFSRRWNNTVYAPVILCQQCEDIQLAIVQEEEDRAWWRRLWTCVVLGNIALVGFFPMVSWFPFGGALLCRGVWKWQAKRQRQGEVSQQRRRL